MLERDKSGKQKFAQGSSCAKHATDRLVSCFTVVS